MHRLLERQLRKSLGRTDAFPEDLQRLVDAVNDAYNQNDEDRALIERSMELSSRELLERNRALALAESKYREIFENVSEGIFQATPEGQFISANPALARICGYDNADQLKLAVGDIALLYQQPGRRKEILEAIDRDGGVTLCESQFRRRDGVIIWISETTHPVRDAEGKIRFYEGTVADVTKPKQAEMERQELQNRLVSISRQAGMAEVATGVLHNVGNILNSVNVSATVVASKLKQSEVASLTKVGELIESQKQDLPRFLTADDRGKLVPDFIVDLAKCLQQEQQAMLSEITNLARGIDHIKQIVTAQQSLAKASNVLLPTEPEKLVEEALAMQGGSIDRHGIEVIRRFEKLGPVPLDKHKVLLILINLIKNAREALKHVGQTARTLTLTVEPIGEGDARRLRYQIIDSGMGISHENLTRIFSHGFTTKPEGHGFGLHSAANAAKEMGGSLVASSDGPGTGACFVLELPLAAKAEGETCKH